MKNNTSFGKYLIFNIIYAILILGYVIFMQTPNISLCVLITIQEMIIMILRPIAAKNYISWYGKRKKLSAEELDAEFIYWKRNAFALGLCMLCLALFMIIYFLGLPLWMDDGADILAGLFLPIIFIGVAGYARSKIKSTKLRGADSNGTYHDFYELGILPMSMLLQEKIWVIDDRTTLSFNSQSERFYPSGWKGRGPSYWTYLINITDLHRIIPEGLSEQELEQRKQELLGKLPRYCYLVQVSTQEELNDIFKEIYKKYLNSENDGLRKIVVVNVRTVASQARLHRPEEYRRQEFLYYTEIERLRYLTYQLLSEVCGDSLDKFDVSDTRIYEISNKNSTQQNTKKISERQRRKFNKSLQQYFEHPNMLRQRIHESVSYQVESNIKNMWLLSFYNSACVFQNPTRSVMALLDYWELLLRMVAIYYYQVTDEPSISEAELVHANLTTLGRFIFEASMIRPSHHKLLTTMKFEMPQVILAYLDNLKDYIYHHYTGEVVSFPGLVSLLQVLRNKIIAHGVLNDENASIVWGITFWATDLLNLYLQMSDFQLNEADNTYEIGFETTVRADRLIVNRGGYPCIAAIQKSNKKSYIYVNFFNGELITPEFVEVDPA